MDLKGNWGFSSSSSSSCILFEASGDSEGDFDPNMGGGYANEIIARFGDGGYVVDDDNDDDAMSCSYDRSEYSSCNVAAEANWGESNCDVADADDDDHEEHDDDDDDDVMKQEDKDGVYGSLYCEDDDEILQEEKLKSFVSFDSNQEFVDEMEKNRLFWEACLAS